MALHLRRTYLSGWFGGVLLVCIAAINAWSGTDKTVADLEGSRPAAASLYHRPRAVHLYHYDKTEVDLAVPLAQQAPEEQRPARHPGTLLAPTAGSGTPPTPTPGRGTFPAPTADPGTSPAPFPVPTNLSPRGPLSEGER